MAFCCVPLCTNKLTSDGISLHTFPRDQHLRSEWLRVLKNAKLSKSSKVCSAHFQSSDFVTRPSTTKYRCLKSTAVPSVFPWTNTLRDRRGDVTRVPDAMDCEEVLPEPVEMTSYQYHDADESAVVVTVQHETSHNDDDVTWMDPTEVKQEPEEPDTIPSELLLICKPDPDTLVSEDAVPEPTEEVRFKEELMPGPDEYIQIVDIQDIFKRKPVENTEDVPKIETVVSLFPYIRNEMEASTSSENSIENPCSPISNQAIEDILKVGVCIQCQECKQFLSDMTTVKTHVCSVPSAGPCSPNISADPISALPSNLVPSTVPISALSPKMVLSTGPNMVPSTGPISALSPKMVPSTVQISALSPEMVLSTGPNLVHSTGPISTLSSNLVASGVPPNMVPGAVPISTLPSNLITRDAFGNIKASECNICNALFISDTALKSHIKSEHPHFTHLTNQSKLVLLPSSDFTTRSVSKLQPSNQAELIELEEDDIRPQSVRNSSLLGKVMPRLVQKKRESFIVVGKEEQGKISCSVFENDSVKSPFQSPFIKTYGKPIPHRESPKTIPREEEPTVSKPSSPHDEFYSHFLKFHYKNHQNQSILLNNLITIPHLVECVGPSKRCKGQFECQQCRERFQTLHQLYLHYKIDHPTSDTNFVKCKVCSFIQVFDVDSILKHLRKHQHNLQHFVVPEKLWQCLECNKLSENCLPDSEIKTVVEIHLKNIIILKSMHDGSTPSSVYFQFRMNPSHPSVPYNQILFSCALCPDRFQTKTELDVHLDSHVDSVFRTCSLCNLKCRNMNVFYEHAKSNHLLAQVPEIEFRSNKIEHFNKNKNVTCYKHQFPLKLINICSLHIHIGDQHNSKLLKQSIDDEKFECPTCDVKFNVAKLFFAHCVPYTPLLSSLLRECIKCGLHFNSILSSRAHLQQVHAGMYEFWCRICRKPQHSYKNLENHVEKHHNVPMIHCLTCHFNFVSNNEAVAHLKSCVRDFVCPICGFLCENLNFLIVHLRVEFHMLAPKHQCRNCLNFFYSKFNLSCHMVKSKCVN